MYVDLLQCDLTESLPELPDFVIARGGALQPVEVIGQKHIAPRRQCAALTSSF